MENLIFLLLGFFFIASIILPWVNRSNIKALNEDLNTLRSDIERIERKIKPAAALPQAPAEQTDSEKASQNQPKNNAEIPKASPIPQASPWPAFQTSLINTPTPTPNIAARADSKTKQHDDPFDSDQISTPATDMEERFGTRLPVWIGGIALSLAGFYFVKYSIDAGWLKPVVRVTIGIIAGLVALYIAGVIRQKQDFANGTRIAQAVAGAGVADLYGCIFAATNLYHLLPPLVGFIGMAAVTAVAVVLSLRHGAPIALLGLVGGFLTPALIGSPNPSAPMLFTYLYVTMVGLLVVMRQQGWWKLSILTITACFLWAVLWLLGASLATMDTVAVGTFVIAVTFTAFGLVPTRNAPANPEDVTSVSWMEVIMIGALALMYGALVKSQFSMAEWSLFGLLAIGGIVLAYFKQSIYGRIPALCSAITAAMLLFWRAPDLNNFAWLVTIFGLIYVVSGIVLLTRSRNPLPWSLLAGLSGIGYFLIAYAKLHTMPEPYTYFWGSLALALASIYVAFLTQVSKKIPFENAHRDNIFATFAATATAFISVGLCMEIDRAFLPVAFAGELLALAWINARTNARYLRQIATIVMAASILLLFPQVLLVVLSLMGYLPGNQHWQLMSSSPLFHFGLPAILFALSSYLLSKQDYDLTTKTLDAVAVFLGTIALVSVARQVLYGSENIFETAPTFLQRGIITNLLFVYGLACLWLGKKYIRSVIFTAGQALFLLAAARIGYYDLLIYNPLLRDVSVGTTPILNALIVTYGLPIYWMSCGQKFILEPTDGKGSRNIYGMMLLLSFVLISFEIRQLFHGEYLSKGPTTNAEIYTYSAAWLAYGLALLFIGTLYKNKMLRIASLGIMFPTVAKVFLYDASALDGLYRVFSFLGLGVSLIGLSWFYSRFVFKREDK